MFAPASSGLSASPFAGNPLALLVVISYAEMFLKVLLCVFEIVLRLCRDHTWTLAGQPAPIFQESRSVTSESRRSPQRGESRPAGRLTPACGQAVCCSCPCSSMLARVET